MAVAAWTGALVDWRAELGAPKGHVAPVFGRGETRQVAGPKWPALPGALRRLTAALAINGAVLVSISWWL